MLQFKKKLGEISSSVLLLSTGGCTVREPTLGSNLSHENRSNDVFPPIYNEIAWKFFVWLREASRLNLNKKKKDLT